MNRRHALLGFATTLITGPAAAAEVCRLTPRSMEGPFYFDPSLVRADITEGRPGAPLDLGLKVVGPDCSPIAGARIDLWHADALGQYSGYMGQGDDRTISTRGKTFMRGTQVSDAGGEARFRTVYPGWYRGRTAHYHFKVILERGAELTGQIYFPDEVSAAVYRDLVPYRERPGRQDTTNRNDGLFRRGGEATLATLAEDTGRFRAALTIGIDPKA